MKDLLISTIKKVDRNYATDELAYLAFTSKVETTLRDKIAFLIHLELKNDYLVSREWLKKGNNNRTDLAIFDQRNNDDLVYRNDPIALIEFKAHSGLRREVYFENALGEDFKKMFEKACDDTEMYYVFFNNFPEIEFLPENNQTCAIGYRDILKNFFNKFNLNERVDKIIEFWNSYLKRYKLPLDRYELVTIKAGEYYDVPISIKTFIYGPIYQDEIVVDGKYIRYIGKK